MAQIPEKVLAWLYRVLHEYQDPQRAYSDAVRTLTAYPTLSPRTEVYNYDNGSSALLLTLAGTLPVNFRGSTYRFPIQLWVPQSYPQEPPMAYVIPGQDMVIRPGQHVSVDGRVYHPYLADWGRIWDRASIAEFLEYLQQAFAKEPPVISRAQQQQYQRPIGQSQQQQQPGASPAPPSLPPKQRIGSAAPVETETPPPRPPKPGEEPTAAYPARTSSRQASNGGPPLPPLPHERQQSGQYVTPSSGYQPGYGGPLQPVPPAIPPDQHRSGRLSGPPLPPIPVQQGLQQPPHQPQRPGYDPSPVSPVSPINGYSELAQPRSIPQQQVPPHQYRQPPGPQLPQQQYSQYPPQPQAMHHHPQHPQQYPPQQPYPQQYPPQQKPQPKKQPPPDLLSDPFDIALSGPSPGSQAPAPPIPPNPEKEHLLHAISASLVQQAQQNVNQSLSAMAPLQAQQQALRAAQDRLETEIRQLDQLDQTLASNESILRRAIQDCDRTISTAKTKPLPPIDDVLIAPTMVANQLWTLCAEEAACREAMYVLQRAVDRGRVSGHDFVRQMRALGRERFLKMVLARKCARGLGLEVKGR
ncbi:suppressor protein stp22 of temperature-sensitive alpha-factor receptor and arginine permease [Saxophila tyrrhenica]|uniref:Suppressor protein stp22 of temperature-sensitive alpha-factor receptor and arginine permease n=1 Tax=Saxophila tyrrhenica TaxID=1690608 RepID=A0AAV9PBF6_9PEZI|nr:suppressor protein stp22 of temperature-sensitive alpha-factor receptor and arginine permease [Saxophila tyrrhenica]